MQKKIFIKFLTITGFVFLEGISNLTVEALRQSNRNRYYYVRDNIKQINNLVKNNNSSDVDWDLL